MYFLSEEERRLLLRRHLPQTRETPVSDELRGWSWATPPLSPVYGAALGVSEVAGRYCPTARDVYLRHVLHERHAPNAAMAEGALYHAIIAEVILRAKQAIYRDGSGCLPALEGLEEPALPPIPAEARASALENGSAAVALPGAADCRQGRGDTGSTAAGRRRRARGLDSPDHRRTTA